ncbi:MAG: hypothetical protein JRN29_01450 [Nitrososphaerota archaeon]|nr:hypothetical protein [Nitrososphaerota archaeon]
MDGPDPLVRREDVPRKSGSSYLGWMIGRCTKVRIRAEPDGTMANFYAKTARRKGTRR